MKDAFGLEIKEGDFVFGSTSTKHHSGDLYRVYKLTPSGFSGIHDNGPIHKPYISGVMKQPGGFIVIPPDLIPQSLRSRLLAEQTYSQISRRPGIKLVHEEL